MNSFESSTSVSLLGRLQQSRQDEFAWREFVDRYGKRIFEWCENRRIHADDAEDITQEVLVRMCKYLRSFEYDARLSFTAYLRRATENAISDFLSHKHRHEMAEGGSSIISWMKSVEAREDLASRLQEVFDLELLERAMADVRRRINDSRWQAWYQTTIQQRANVEVAHELGISIGTLYAAKNQVANLIRDEIQRLEHPGGGTEQTSHLIQ
ncbi:MAG: sigma-70 family RNA polymerase sigma factor [Pirellulaceae bacterium]